MRNRIGILVLTVLTLGFVGWCTSQADTDSKALQEQITREAQQEKERLTTAAQEHKIAFGMSAELVRKAWGKPQHINKTVTANRVEEQWVYGEQYVYISNGKVSAWQDH